MWSKWGIYREVNDPSKYKEYFNGIQNGLKLEINFDRFWNPKIFYHHTSALNAKWFTAHTIHYPFSTSNQKCCTFSELSDMSYQAVFSETLKWWHVAQYRPWKHNVLKNWHRLNRKSNTGVLCQWNTSENTFSLKFLQWVKLIPPQMKTILKKKY